MKTISNFDFKEIISDIKAGRVDTLCVVTSSIHEDDEYDNGNYLAEYDEPCFAGTTSDECRQTINALVAEARAEIYQYITFYASQIRVNADDVEDFDPEFDDAEDFIAAFIAEHIAESDNIGTDDWNTQDVHYDGYESMMGGIALYWAWDRYVGYARTFKRLEYCTDNVTTLRCKPVDRVFSSQCTLLVSAAELKDCKTASELRDLIQQRFDDMGQWRSNCKVENFLEELYRNADPFTSLDLPENDIFDID